MEEVKEAVGKLGNGKAVGVDNVCGELLKLGLSENSAILKCFHNIVVAVWQQEVVPQEWKGAIMTMLFKKGDPYECGNFRSISLGAHAGKVVLKVVTMRLNAYCEWRKILLEAQYGFRVGRSTDGMIYVVRGVQELAREKDLPLFMFFIDLQKAYDSVDRSLLWKVLARYGVPAKLISIIRQFHDGMRACGRLDSGETSEWFAVKQGIRQGCVIAPDLFNIFFVAVLTVAFDGFSIDKVVLDDFVRVVARGDLAKEAAKRVLWAMLYADDAGIASRSQASLERMMTAIVEVCAAFGLITSVGEEDGDLAHAPPHHEGRSGCRGGRGAKVQPSRHFRVSWQHYQQRWGRWPLDQTPYWLRLELLPQVQQGGVRQPIHRSGRQGPFPEGGSTRGHALRLCDLDSLARRLRQAAGSPPRNAAEVSQCLHLDAGRS